MVRPSVLAQLNLMDDQKLHPRRLSQRHRKPADGDQKQGYRGIKGTVKDFHNLHEFDQNSKGLLKSLKTHAKVNYYIYKQYQRILLATCVLY